MRSSSPDQAIKLVPDDKIRRVVICSGKVYYDLYEEREKRGIDDVYLLRMEQLYPFPARALIQELSRFKGAEMVWCQEEPKNMGAWTFIEPNLAWVLDHIEAKHRRPRYVGRPSSAATATGLASKHHARVAGLPRRGPGLGPAETRAMATEIRVPVLGESVVEATVGQWFKQAGRRRLRRRASGRARDRQGHGRGARARLWRAVGDRREAGRNGRGRRAARRHQRWRRQGQARQGYGHGKTCLGHARAGNRRGCGSARPGPAPVEPAPPVEIKELEREPQRREEVSGEEMPPSPAARKLLAEAGLEPGKIKGSGRRGQILKQDVLSDRSRRRRCPAPTPAPAGASNAVESLLARERKPKPPAPPRAPVTADDASREERVRMTRLRQTIARRLKEAQDTAAMLTTFNDVDMGGVMQLRRDYRDAFEQKHGVKLGLMGFFVKACVQALKDIPAVNAEIDGEDIVYKNYYHIGVAVGTERGLVVPVLRDADRMSLAEIETTIADFGGAGANGKLALEEMQGGTFTISNGGIYGSLLSTPILNAPQSGILGMHRIEERPVVRDGAIVARPMMYLALSYDHRLVDGKDAVTFLVNVEGIHREPRPPRPRFVEAMCHLSSCAA